MNNVNNIAVCTVCNNNFIDGCSVLLYSLIKNNEWFNGDFIVSYDDTYSPLSDDSKSKLLSIYDNVVFNKVNLSEYTSLFSHWDGHVVKRFLPSAFTYEIFSFTKYDKVLYLDSDMLVTNDISDVFTYDIPIGFCGHTYVDVKKPIIAKNIAINLGMIYLNNKLIDSLSIKKDILECASTFDFSSEYYHACFEQDVFRYFALKYDWYQISSKYNTLKRVFYGNKKELTDECVIHYLENKPWNTNESGYTYINSIWKSYYNELINKKK